MNTLTIWPGLLPRTRQQAASEIFPARRFAQTGAPAASSIPKRQPGRQTRCPGLAESILASRQMAESA